MKGKDTQRSLDTHQNDWDNDTIDKPYIPRHESRAYINQM
jgi:hypothetical protein